jgi:ABC-type anion transport system duplicated permease subunit
MTSIPALTFPDVVLAIHIMAVVVAFGVTFAYPIIFAVFGKADPRARPALYRAVHTIGTRLILPGLGVVILAGIYLASHLHMWSHFFVQWGLAASIVLGASGGLFFSPTERRLIELAERDVAAAGSGEVLVSAEHEALSKRLAIVGTSFSLLVLVTIFIMVVGAP